MMKPKQLNKAMAAAGRLGRAISKNLAADGQDPSAVYASPANKKLMQRLARIRRTETPAQIKRDEK